MRKHVWAILLAGASAPAFAGDYTATSGLGMTPEQRAVSFDLAELSFKVDPAKQTLAGDARLTFTPTRAITEFAVELDPRYKLSSLSVDGKQLAQSDYRWSEGRLHFPVAAVAQLRASPSRATLRPVGRDLVLRVGHLVGRLELALAERGRR